MLTALGDHFDATTIRYLEDHINRLLNTGTLFIQTNEVRDFVRYVNKCGRQRQAEIKHELAMLLQVSLLDEYV